MFKVGQKVRCVDDRYSNAQTMEVFKNWVTRDEVYTIRKQRPAGAESGVLLEEVVNPPFYNPNYGGKLEPAFHPKRFVLDEEEETKSEEMVEQAKELLKEEVLVEEILN